MKRFVIQFEQLSHGEHDYEFDIDKEIFSENEDILDAGINASLRLLKTGNMMDMKFHFKGNFIMPCDRCNDPVKVSLDDESKLVVKYGQVHHENFDELVVLEDHEHELDLEPYFYETLSLLIPIRRVHDIRDCNPEIVAQLEETDKHDEKGDTDPRWEKLKEI